MEIPERRYQVFISSTFRDLQEERQKVLQAVLELQAFPSGMEMFPSADEDQWEFIKREIDSSDYYVVIVAGKYGSVASDGISYTEKEYDYAIATRKPVHAFLYRDLNDLKGAQLEEDRTKSASLKAFREKISANRLVKFYKNPDELKGQVLQALMTAFHAKPQEGWVKARHLRRIEDLDQINALQQQIRRLEAENARLQEHDPTTLLAQGNDTVEATFRLSPAEVERGLRGEEKVVGIAPPVEEVTIMTTWDELLLSLLPGGLPSQGRYGPHDELLELIRDKVVKQFPAGFEWASEAHSGNYGYKFEGLLEEVRLQLQGLGLITVSVTGDARMGGRREKWELTEKGKLRFALLAGRRRSLSTPEKGVGLLETRGLSVSDLAAPSDLLGA